MLFFILKFENLAHMLPNAQQSASNEQQSPSNEQQSPSNEQQSPKNGQQGSSNGQQVVQRSDLTLYHAAKMVKNVSSTTIHRWGEPTLKKLLGGVPARVGESHEGPLTSKEIASWFKETMIGLINEKLKSEGHDLVDPDEFKFL